MKIAVLGYGRMGKEIEKAALDRGHEIALIIDDEDDWNEKQEGLAQCDAAIDFSRPDAVVTNIYRCFEKNVPVIVGTTAWNDRLKEVKEHCRNKDQTLFVASNFSIGVNILFELNKQLAGLMDKYAEYEPVITETHHIHKIDAPSGTAITLANEMIKQLARKSEWNKEKSEHPGQVAVKSIREDEIPGTHRITYDSAVDSVEIKHEAKNRKGFARGAVVAAEWVKEKKGFFEMKDMLFAR
ncbi:MAG: 4-hydroxy-tetrahydrodipicolinate reductase [Bacteroidales bacterium]|nr:4-hydroxy-tetrahydrodipicolinate reductase [Bacteroidales bacterium]